MNSSCPDRQELQELCSGGTSAAREAELTTHIDGCVTCREALDELGGGAELRSDLARLGDRPTSDALQAKLRALKSGFVDGRGGSPEFADVLPWLEPLEDGRCEDGACENGLGRLADYLVLECVGRGGMGVVFRARDEKLQREVALKVMAPALVADNAARQRFLREARAAAGVNHPHVVTVHAVDEVRRLPYLVMEFVEGESLQQRLDRAGPLSVDELIRVGCQIAQGLRAAHASGVVHRDVKPANVLLEAHSDCVKLTDFGLARSLDGSSLTRSGLVIGTPEFLAPEQVEGRPIDHRADLFSLGSVLYVGGTGRLPFSGNSLMATLGRICSATPEPMQTLNPAVPDGLASLVQKLHEQDPALRPENAHAVVDALQGQVTSHSRDATPPPPPLVVARPRTIARPRKSIATFSLATWVAGGFAVLTMLAVAYWLGGGWATQRQAVAERNERGEVPQNPLPRGEVPRSELGQDEVVQREATPSLSTARSSLPTTPRALAAADGDELQALLEREGDLEVTLTGDGPYLMPAMVVEDRRVELRAGSGVVPRLWFELSEDPAIFVDNGQLALEGVVLECGAGDEEFEEPPALLVLEEGALTAKRCRFINRVGPCLETEASHCAFDRCELWGNEENVAVLWRPRAGDLLRFVDSLVAAGTGVEVQGGAAAELVWERTSLFGTVAMVFTGEDERRDGFKVKAQQSLFDTEDALLLVEELEPGSPVGELVTWEGEGNWLPPQLARFLDWDGVQRLRVDTVADFRSALGAKSVDSRQGLPRYRTPRTDLFDRLEEGTLRSRDLQVRRSDTEPRVGVNFDEVGP